MALSKNMLVSMVQEMWRYAGAARSRLLMFYGMILVANIIVSFQPMVLSKIINTIQNNGFDALHDTILWAAAYGGLTIAFWILHGPARVIERRVSFIAFENMVTSLYNKVTAMPLRWHQDHHSGNTINRVNKASQALYIFGQNQFVILQIIVRFTMAIILLSLYSWWVMAISLVASFIISFLIRRFDRVLIPLIKIGNEGEHHLNAALYDYIGNIITVLTLRLQGDTAAEVQSRIDRMRPYMWRKYVINEWKWGIVNILLVSTQAGIVGAYIAYHLWRHDALVIGSVVAIFQYLLMISGVFYDAAAVYGDLMQRHADLHTVDDLIADHDRLAAPAKTDSAQSWREIHIQGLTFTHQEGQDLMHTLRDINLAIAAGQKIALIGQSGSGKTTLLTLMRGLYQAPHVQLSIDGVSYNNLSPLAGFTTLVPQDCEIFENTVLYNLTLATHVPNDTLKQALAITTLDEVAAKLPNGLATDIRERGVNLSGGQKQRLALTRGLIAARNSSLLLLDEPTSSVDLATEATIFDRLFTVFADKAIVASIHRLHLLPRFDRIGFIQNGMIVEQGPFVELLSKRGKFYQLWQDHLAQALTVNEAKQQ